MQQAHCRKDHGCPLSQAGTASSAKHVVSVSIGSSKRATHVETDLLGTPVLLERRGTDGDVKRAAALIRELDGKVDAIGLGGLDIYLMAGGRRFEIREGRWLADQAKLTPVVCGAGLKDTLERMVVDELDSLLNWRDRRVLMVLAVDRFGMAEALHQRGADVIYGDVIFALGLPVPLRNAATLAYLVRLLAPVLLKLPIGWLYPTGKRQDAGEVARGLRYFDWAEVIAGDFHVIRRYAPTQLRGKVILTNTTTAEDVDTLRRRGVKTLITTTPRFGGRSLSTNLLEAAFVAVSGKHPLSAPDYRRLIRESGIKPDVLALNPEAARVEGVA